LIFAEETVFLRYRRVFVKEIPLASTMTEVVDEGGSGQSFFEG
jgi:hypothetical protein